MMTGMNAPCRIGHAVCLPGDIVLGTISGVTFIPAHLAEFVASSAEKTHIKDVFGFERLADGTYSSAQIDTTWTLEILEDFLSWMKTAEAARDYQHLDWSEELAAAQNPKKPKVFDGLVGYSTY